jgi:glutamine synthetase
MPFVTDFNEILEQMKIDDVEFVNLQFSDMMGMAKSVTIPVSKFPEAYKHGLWFDGSSIEGFTRIYESDMLLRPDLDTYAVIPWLSSESGNIARVICDVYTPEGEPYEGDPRYILKKVLKEADDMGFVYNTGPELEFFLFRKENGRILTSENKQIVPHDSGQYFDLVLDRGFEVRRDMMNALRQMDIDVEASHHEVAPGQHEIGFKYSNALSTADKVMTLKYTLKSVAAKHGLYATFMPKPVTGVNGNGMHVHQSLFSKSGENLFFNKDDKYQLSDTAYQFMAGQMKNIKAMCAILNPTVNSYKRLVPGYEASTYICWARINRSALIRIPKYSKGKEKSTRIEIRNPDPSSNPYLAFAVLLKAGLDGIKNSTQAPPPVEEDVFGYNYSQLEEKNIDLLPMSLWSAVKHLKNNELIQDTLGKSFAQKYADAKEKEGENFRLAVTDWEINNYLENI